MRHSVSSPCPAKETPGFSLTGARVRDDDENGKLKHGSDSLIACDARTDAGNASRANGANAANATQQDVCIIVVVTESMIEVGNTDCKVQHKFERLPDPCATYIENQDVQ